MVLLFIGPSGSGKDTQAEILVEKSKFERISTGDLMREISEGENKMQQLLKKAMNEGFMADNFVFGLLQIYLSDAHSDNLILSGVVRRNSQIELLDFTLFKVNKRLDKVIYFELDDAEAIRRMSGRLRCMKCMANYHTIYNPPKQVGICDNCGGVLTRRPDDNPESIQKRLDDYHKDNKEIMEEYEKRGILVKIDASKTIEEISTELTSKLNLNGTTN